MTVKDAIEALSKLDPELEVEQLIVSFLKTAALKEVCEEQGK